MKKSVYFLGKVLGFFCIYFFFFFEKKVCQGGGVKISMAFLNPDIFIYIYGLSTNLIEIG